MTTNDDSPTKSTIDWDHLQSADICRLIGNYRDAAASGNPTANRTTTLRNHIAKLESQLQTTIFLTDGQTLKQGPGTETLFSALQSMRAAAKEFLNPPAHEISQRETMTIYTDDVLNALWIQPHLPQFKARAPTIIPRILSNGLVNPSNMDKTSILITPTVAHDRTLTATRIATLWFTIYGSDSYFARHGAPSNIDDLLHHDFIELFHPSLTRSLIDSIFDGIHQKPNVVMETDSFATASKAAEKGEGLIILPNLFSATPRPLKSLKFSIATSIPLFAVYSPDLTNTTAGSELLSWITSIFDPNLHPYFGSLFLFPKTQKSHLLEIAS